MTACSHSSLKCLVALLAAIIYLFTVNSANAQETSPILLTINITNPDAVVISSTGADPSQSVNGSIGAGFDLIGLLGPGTPTSNDSNYLSSVVSTLTPGAAAGQGIFNEATYDNLNGDNDLNLYNTGGNPDDFYPMTFSTTASAFATGTSLTANLGALTLLPVGSIGEIETGFNGSVSPPGPTATATPNEVIGSYEVIDNASLSSTPEPSSWTLSLMVIALLGFLRFRLRRT